MRANEPYELDITIPRDGETLLYFQGKDPRKYGGPILFVPPTASFNTSDFILTVRNGKIGRQRMELNADATYSRLTSPNAPLGTNVKEAGVLLAFKFAATIMDSAFMDEENDEHLYYQLRWLESSTDDTGILLYQGKFTIKAVTVM